MTCGQSHGNVDMVDAYFVTLFIPKEALPPWHCGICRKWSLRPPHDQEVVGSNPGGMQGLRVPYTAMLLLIAHCSYIFLYSMSNIVCIRCQTLFAFDVKHCLHLMSNIVCIRCQTLYSMSNIVFDVKHCIRCQTLYSMSNIVFDVKHCLYVFDVKHCLYVFDVKHCLYVFKVKHCL
jgi:hypothetical protein